MCMRAGGFWPAAAGRRPEHNIEKPPARTCSKVTILRIRSPDGQGAAARGAAGAHAVWSSTAAVLEAARPAAAALVTIPPVRDLRACVRDAALVRCTPPFALWPDVHAEDRR